MKHNAREELFLTGYFKTYWSSSFVLQIWHTDYGQIKTIIGWVLTLYFPPCFSYILVTDSLLFTLREIPKRPGWAYVQHRHYLNTVLKITSRRKYPDLITFKFGDHTGGEEVEVTAVERYVIPGARKATKKITEAILKVVGER